MPSSETPKEQVPTHDSFGGCLANLFWLIACPGVLVMAALGIAAGGDPGLRWLDLVYWVTVPLAPVARWVESRVARRRGSADGPEAAGTGHRYALRFAAVAAGLWVAAHVTAYFARTGKAG
jgi:hypothetical protein